MLVTLALVLLAPQSIIAQLDEYARERNVEGVSKLASKELLATGQPFRFLQVQGAYEVGKFGWSAVPLKDPVTAKTYVVFSTKLTSEDIGEQVFEMKGGKLVRHVPEMDPMGHRIKHHEFTVSFNLAAKTTAITDVVTFEKLKRAQGSFMVRFSPNYRVSQIMDSRGKGISFAQGGGVVLLKSSATSPFKYKMTYGGVVNQPMYAGSVSEKEATLTNDYWYPMVARGPATYRAIIYGPRTWTAVAQGEPSSTIVGSGGGMKGYFMTQPVTYFSLTAAPLMRHRAQINGKHYTVWSTTMTQEEMKLQAELNAPIIEFYEKSFGKYPFSGWGSLESEHYGGGALEAYSYATYGHGWLPDEDAHEPAHTWWGGIINNTYQRSFWNESFAVFSDGLYNRECPIGNREERRLAFVSDVGPDPSYLSSPVASAGASLGGAASGLGYGKGANVLQMLEMELGTETMIRCMRDWIATHPKGVPGEWEDFEKVVNRFVGAKGNGKRLFFDQWLRKTGWADFNLTDVRVEGNTVAAKIAWNGQPYHILTDVMIEYSDGHRQLSRVSLTPSGSATVPLMPGKTPKLISYDPWRKLLRRYGSDEMPPALNPSLRRFKVYRDPARKDWLSQITGDPNRSIADLPADLNNTLVIGHPDTTPAMRPLCDKAGFKVAGNSLTYDGTTIDLANGSALALVELGEGKRCIIGLGKVRRAPNAGRSWLCLTDGLGRFLRGKTNPKTSGFLTHRL